MAGVFLRPRIPLTVIGGFLGAGKTSLLNHLLAQQAPGRRTAVLVNDFGSINIDRALIAAEGMDAIELTNGCVCCQIGDDLTAALIDLLDSPRPPDAIVVEASGVSDPWRIAQVSLADPALALEAVIVVLDAAMLRSQYADPLLADTVQRQLEAADLLVVNKIDQVDAAARAALHAWLEGLLPATPRMDAIQARVPAVLLGGLSPAAGRPQRLRCPHCADGSGSACGHAPDHGEVFGTWSLTSTPVFSAQALRALLKAMPPGVLRLKGLVRTDEHALAEIQFAGRHGSLRAARGADAAAANTLVAIGHRDRLPTASLDRAFADACCRQAVNETSETSA